MMEQDEELVRKAREGDADAFGILIERHQKAVFAFLLSVLREPDLAEESAQMAFVKAFQGLKSFEGRASFKTWVSQIALNAARSQLRWRKLRSWISLSGSSVDGNLLREESLRPSHGGPDELKTLEKKMELERAMEGLSPREREVAALRLEGYSLDEIAGTLGVTQGTVKSTLFQAMRKMEERLS